MKLIGYIKPYKTFSSSIPIYFEGNDYYYHSLNDKFIITSFSKADFDLSFLINVKKLKRYEIGNIGPIVFIGEDYNKLFIGEAKKTILDICNYFDKQNFTKKYVQEEIFFYAGKLDIDITEHYNKFQLKSLVQNNYLIISKDIQKLVELIENYVKEYKIKRSRKSSFKHQKKSKTNFGVTINNYDNTKIESYKNYFITFINSKEYRKGFHQLQYLISYQFKVSTPEHIVKSLCDISISLIEIGAIISSKTLLYLANLFDIKDPVIESQLAEIFKSEGNLKDAKKLYIKIQKQFPSDVFSKTSYAEILKKEGNLKDAKDLYIEIQKQFPDNIVAKTGYAEILKEEGDINEAKTLYIEIQKQFPSDVVAKNGYAETLKAEGNIKKAKDLYIEIQKQFPSDIFSKTSYAEILKKEGNIKDSKSLYIEIQKQFPENIVAKTGYAEVLKEEGNINEAKALYIEIQKQFPFNVVAKNGYAEILKTEGNNKKAKDLYIEIQKQFPSDVVSKNGYAEILKEEGNINEAKALYLKTQKQFPFNVVAKNGYAEILKEEGNINEAKALYLKTQKQFPFNVVAKNGYAEILKEEGNINEAKALYLEIQKKFPYDVVSKNGYAEILKEEGNINESKALYLEIQKQFPENLITRHSLLSCYLALNEINNIDENLFIKSNPITQTDYYFYHSYIIYNIKIGEFSLAENLIIDVLNQLPFFESRNLFKRTLIYIKILQSKFHDLLVEIINIPTTKNNPIENIFKTHIFSENEKKEEALECLNIIKKFPKNSVIYSNASLLSEIYDLNGLPKKGLNKSELHKLLIEEEYKALTLYT